MLSLLEFINVKTTEGRSTGTWRPQKNRWYILVYVVLIVLVYIGLERTLPWIFPESYAKKDHWEHSDGQKLVRRDGSDDLYQPFQSEWYPPSNSRLNSLSYAINGSETNGFVLSPSWNSKSAYNWCNMPHVRPAEYKRPNTTKFQLHYVEVIHRHHKRTPSLHNVFPGETRPDDCPPTTFFSSPCQPHERGPRKPIVPAYLSRFSDNFSNPFNTTELLGNCQFPQLSQGGLDNSMQHGRDLYAVYHDILSLIPDSKVHNRIPDEVSFHVTNNPITSEVAAKVLQGMFGRSTMDPVPLRVQPPDVDPLAPGYPCPLAKLYYESPPGLESNSLDWEARENASIPLYETLDRITGIEPLEPRKRPWNHWHETWSGYFDNLSARRCHGRPLPCHDIEQKSISTNQTMYSLFIRECVSPENADAVFRMGQWEYDWIYRSSGPHALVASVASFGVWIQELFAHFAVVIKPNRPCGQPKNHTMPAVPRTFTRYRHNVAHDRSIASLLSILQVDEMVWPGMGAEVVFELYKAKAGSLGVHYGDSEWYVRILWNGQVLKSSHPELNAEENEGLLSLDRLGKYFQDLGIGIGQIAQKGGPGDKGRIKEMCGVYEEE